MLRNHFFFFPLRKEFHGVFMIELFDTFNQENVLFRQIAEIVFELITNLVIGSLRLFVDSLASRRRINYARFFSLIAPCNDHQTIKKKKEEAEEKKTFDHNDR